MVLVYTCHIGDDDPLQEPECTRRGNEFICFTDRRLLRSKVWQRVSPVADLGSPRLTARWHKFHPHAMFPGQPTVWVDGTFKLKTDPRVLLAKAGRHHMLAMPHPFRDNIIQEAKAILEAKLAPQRALDAQIVAYTLEGWNPARQPVLTTTGLLVRQHTHMMEIFHELWWQELERWGHPRDQMSVDFCAWKAGIKIGFLPGHYRGNDWVTYYSHGGKRTRILPKKMIEKHARRFV